MPGNFFLDFFNGIGPGGNAPDHNIRVPSHDTTDASVDFLANADIAVIAQNRTYLASICNFLSGQLVSDEMTLPFFDRLSTRDKEERVARIMATLRFTSLRARLNAVENQESAMKDDLAVINRCRRVLVALEDTNPAPLSEEHSVAIAVALDLKSNIIDSLQDLQERLKPNDSFTMPTLSTIDAINRRRFWWIWGNALIMSILTLFPADFFFNQAAQQALAIPSMIGGYLSFILYFTRFSLHMGLVLKHTIAGPWMSEDEKKIPWPDRFWNRWDYSQWTVWNDTFWGPLNFACFYYLIGALQTTAGLLGSALTGAMLLVDVTFTLLRFRMETKAGEEKIRQLKEAITNAKPGSLEERELKKLLRQEQINFDFNYRQTKYALAYAVGLAVSFAVLCCMFCPPLIAITVAPAIFGVAGAVLCFFFSTFNSVADQVLKSQKSRTEATFFREQAAEINTLVRTHGPNTLTHQDLQSYYLNHETAMARANHKDQMSVHQFNMMLGSTVLDILIPVVVFSALLFLPYAIGIPVLISGIALGVLALKSYERKTKPNKDPKLAEKWNDDEFKTWADSLNRLSPPNTNGNGHMNGHSGNDVEMRPLNTPLLQPTGTGGVL